MAGACVLISPSPEPSTVEERAWVRSAGRAVSDRGRLHPEA